MLLFTQNSRASVQFLKNKDKEEAGAQATLGSRAMFWSCESKSPVTCSIHVLINLIQLLCRRADDKVPSCHREIDGRRSKSFFYLITSVSVAANYAKTGQQEQ